MSDRPTSREEYTTTGSGSVDRRGDGLDLGGPVGNSGGYGSRPGLRRRGGRGWLWLVLILIVINAVSEGVTFADIKQFVSEQIREIDPDEIKEGAGELARSARENIDLAVNGAEGAESREAVADFSGTVSDGDGIISVLAGEKPSAQQGGALLNQDHFEWTRNRKLQKVLALTEQEWENVDTIKLNVFVDDGGGFIDLGLDPLFKFQHQMMACLLYFLWMFILMRAILILTRRSCMRSLRATPKKNSTLRRPRLLARIEEFR